MAQSTVSQITIPERKLRDFCNAVWTKLGVPEKDAHTTTDVLVTADLRGVDSHGVARLPRYYTDLKNGWTKPTDQSRILGETKATAMIDGGQSLGQVVGRRGMELAIRKAKETAVGIVSVRNSHHYGIAGYYSLMALEHDLIGVSMISLTAPASKEHRFVLDMATSVVPRGKLEVYDRQKKAMPLGWAVDTTGRETSDPHAVLDALSRRLGGGILPLGGEGEEHSGHKGYGLALMVDVLCGVLSGSATGLGVDVDKAKPNVGHFFMAVDPAAFRPLDEFKRDMDRLARELKDSPKAFRPLDEFKRDMDRLARELKDSPKAHGQNRIYVHGEKSFARMERYRREGIPLTAPVVESMKKVGNEIGVPWPV